MKRYITENGVKFLIRGPWTAKELRQQYKKFMEKYPTTKTTFRQWLNHGKVYFKV